MFSRADRGPLLVCCLDGKTDKPPNNRQLGLPRRRWRPQKAPLRPYLLTYGAEPFLRSRQMCSPSRTPQHFMELQGSIPCSQEPSTGPYPEHINPIQSIPFYISKIQFNIVHPLTSWSYPMSTGGSFPGGKAAGA
jgi:hypothetical protein